MPDHVIEPGSKALEVTLQGECGEDLALHDLWTGAERGIVLSFLRHYG